MRIYIDATSRQIISSPTFSLELLQLSFKRGATSPIEIQFVQNGAVIGLPLDATGSIEIKETGKYDEDPITGAAAWIVTGTGSDSVYSFDFSFVNPALDALFVVDGDASNDVAVLTLMGEIQWITGGVIAKTATFVVSVANDVIRELDTLPNLPTIDYGVFLPNITDVVGGGPTDLDAVATVTLHSGIIIEVLVLIGGIREWLTYVLTDGAAAGSTPGTITPLDYNALTNDRRWVGAVGPSGPTGVSGYSGYSGSGYSGFSGSGKSGYSGFCGLSGYSGFCGKSGYSGFCGLSGYSGFCGLSGYSGFCGLSGYSGFCGRSGYSGYSGSGTSGFSGSGKSGYSGFSGLSGYSGFSAASGFSGFSSKSGYSGFCGLSGYSGYSSTSGYSGYSGFSAISGYSGYSGYSGFSGANPGASGYSGFSGYSGYCGFPGATRLSTTLADATSITPNSAFDLNIQINTQSAGTLTVNAPSGSPGDGRGLLLRIKSTNVQTFSWNGIFAASTTLAMPAATTGTSKTDYIGFIYNTTDTKWDLTSFIQGY